MRKSVSIAAMFLLVLVVAFASYSGGKKVAFIDQLKCVKCGTCAKGCPVKAIAKIEKEGKTSYLVDPVKCVSCGTCVKNCPVKAITLAEAVAAKPAAKTDEKAPAKVEAATPSKEPAPAQK